ncbi:hypothetical protein ARHIZOSPH14_11370 [Agromyces rhizosphaerae]|uniref:Uncharacterized protein n=1 Tax=Agromyces rhizosphaerae TaxID=88374 RepID=A0A9W6FNX7_9MICO|nr:hypothetical protein [Agromyces rhizosphaerae]GLI26895.1 hypothetical protein ARHIZOSPH14_11370 [Agromyces rhizosphaerae]
MPSSGVFRPERGVIAMNLVASLVIVGFGVLLIWLAADSRSAWLLAVSLPLIPIGAWIAARCLVMRITFDATGLHIVGFVRSRRIPRTAVLFVEQGDLELPMIQWSMPGAVDRWSILTPLMLNPSPFLPASMYSRRHRFLAQLRRWAPDTDAGDVRPGAWSRMLDALASAVMAIARSPLLRVACAIAAIAVAVGAYWLGVATMTTVLQTSYEPRPRGWFAPLGLSALAAEASYWLLPLRTRRPRTWHIALAALMSPLAVLTLTALFA